MVNTWRRGPGSQAGPVRRLPMAGTNAAQPPVRLLPGYLHDREDDMLR